MKKLVISFLLFSCSILLIAQKAPMKLGKVPIEDIQMDVYPADSSADAVLLCEYGVFDDAAFHFYHQRRLKIITKEGLGQLIFNIPGNSKSDVRGFVFNLDEDGKVVKEKIGRDHIYIEKSGGMTSVRVAPPNVREGTVLDIEYGYDNYPSLWQFQRTIPVRHSELYIPSNENFSFRFQQIGYETLTSRQSQHFVATNMPAFHAESYVNSINNYMTALLIDLTAIHGFTSSGTGFFRNYCEDWGNVNKHFYEHESFGMRMDDPCLFLNKPASIIMAKETDPRKRIDLAFQAVTDQVAWSEEIDMYPEVNLKEVWDQGSGTAADMNFIFMSLLGKLDIDVAPVLISTRHRGTVNPHLPTINRFNAVLSCAILGDEYLVMDVSDKYNMPGTLPSRSLNGGGLMIQKEKGTWIDIEAKKPDSQMNSCQLTLDEDGNFEGKLSIRYSDYAANDFRELWDMYTSEDEYLEEFEDDYDNVFVVEYSNDVEANNYGPVNETMDVELEGYSSTMGDMISFNPVFFDRQEINPFKLEKREYPVDFSTPIREMMIYSVMLPEGFVVEQLPAPIRATTANGSMNFQYQIAQQGNMLQLMIRFEVNKVKFIQDEYEELKQMMNLIVQKEKEQVILKKI